MAQSPPNTKQFDANRVSFRLGSTLQKQMNSRTTSIEGAEYGQILMNNQLLAQVTIDSEYTEENKEHEVLEPPILHAN